MPSLPALADRSHRVTQESSLDQGRLVTGCPDWHLGATHRSPSAERYGRVEAFHCAGYRGIGRCRAVGRAAATAARVHARYRAPWIGRRSGAFGTMRPPAAPSPNVWRRSQVSRSWSMGFGEAAASVTGRRYLGFRWRGVRCLTVDSIRQGRTPHASARKSASCRTTSSRPVRDTNSAIIGVVVVPESLVQHHIIRLKPYH